MKKAIFVLAAAAATALSPIGPVAAASQVVEQAKSDCVAGEQADGYLGIIDDGRASEALRREVRDVNQKRKAYYSDLASRNGVTIEVTAQLTAKQLIDRSPSGHCVRDESGVWLRKP